jgi:hypothetical protein
MKALLQHQDPRSAIADSGLLPPDYLDPSGKVIRWAGNPSKRSRNSWYLYDGTSLSWGDWALGGGANGKLGSWRAGQSQSEDPAVQQERLARLAAAKAEREKAWADKAQTARRIYDSAPDCTQHGYLTRKGIPAVEGLKLARDGRLIVPVYGPDSDLISLQFIAVDSGKRFLSGATTKGGYFVVGASAGSPAQIAIAEGLATAVSIFEATGIPTVVGFSCGNLPAVAETFRQRYPKAKILVCGDQGRGSGHALKAARAVKGQCRIPVLSNGTDFNDLHQSEGLAAVRDQIELGLPWEAQRILSVDPPKADRTTEGNYLPQLPELQLGAINWIAAGMGSGKTVRIGSDWVKAWRARGGVTVVLSPLNSLGQQTAQDWGIPHLHSHHTSREGQRLLQAEIADSGGIVACLNSVHRVKSLIPRDRPLLVVIDEACQTLTDAAVGNTLGSAWADRWADTIALLWDAEAVVLAEDGLDQATIDLVSELSGKPVTGIRHHRKQDPWQVTLYRATAPTGYRAKLFDALTAGERILYVSSAQADCERMAAWATEQGIRHHRIDSTTNEAGNYRAFFEDPDSWLRRETPQLLILSPSGKTGLSIEGSITAPPWFDAVWGYFPTLDVDTALQMLGRYRPAVPRHIWAAAYVTPEPGENPNPIAELRYLSGQAQSWAKLAEVQPETDPAQAPLDRYLATRRARAWAQKTNLADYLGSQLRAAGHAVTVIWHDQRDPEVADTWRRIQDDLALGISDESGNIDLTPEQDPKWAREILSGLDTTRSQRLAARKVLQIEKFPGLDWGSPALWLAAVYGRRPLAKGASLWAESFAVDSLRVADTAEARKILAKPLAAKHHLPTRSKQAALAAQFVPLLTGILGGGTIHPTGKAEAQIVALARQHSSEIKRLWRITITGEETTTATVNKLSRKFGLTVERRNRISVKGSRLWVYRVAASPTWWDLVDARSQSLGIGGGTDLLKPLPGKEYTNLYHPPQAPDPPAPKVADPPPIPEVAAVDPVPFSPVVDPSVNALARGCRELMTSLWQSNWVYG